MEDSRFAELYLYRILARNDQILTYMTLLTTETVLLKNTGAQTSLKVVHVPRPTLLYFSNLFKSFQGVGESGRHYADASWIGLENWPLCPYLQYGYDGFGFKHRGLRCINTHR